MQELPRKDRQVLAERVARTVTEACKLHNERLAAYSMVWHVSGTMQCRLAVLCGAWVVCRAPCVLARQAGDTVHCNRLHQG